jgi:hypothetical protein
MGKKLIYLTKQHRFGACTASNQNDIYKGYDAMTEPNLSKVCSKCQETKPLSEFHKDKSKKDGLRKECKECRSRYSQQYHKQNKEKINEYNKHWATENEDWLKNYYKNYRETNKNKISIANKEYRTQNRDRLLEYNKIYYENNKEKFSTSNKIYREKNKDSILHNQQNYYKNNREAILKQNKNYRKINRKTISEQKKKYSKTEIGKQVQQKASQKRRALKQNATIENFSPSEVFERDGYICQLCGIKTRPDFKNHHHPKYPNLDHVIPLSLCGEHSKRNTQCLCHQCNMEKHHTGKGDQLRLFG